MLKNQTISPGTEWSSRNDTAYSSRFSDINIVVKALANRTQQLVHEDFSEPCAQGIQPTDGFEQCVGGLEHLLECMSRSLLLAIFQC
jgi:hypothetical protein